MRVELFNMVQNFEGPSQNYKATLERFDTILEEKFGIINNPELTQIKDIAPTNPIYSGGLSQGTSSEAGAANYLASGNGSSDGNADRKERKNSILEIYNEISNANSKNVPVADNGKADVRDIRKKSAASVDELNQLLSGSLLQGQGINFKRAEDIYGVNAYVLMAIAKLESAWGESKIARDKNNLFGYGAFDSAPYESAKTYASYEDSIYDVAKHLSENYLSPGGAYFNGYSLDGVNQKYSTSPEWASKVRRIVSELTY